jgi:hypothetical protein
MVIIAEHSVCRLVRRGRELPRQARDPFDLCLLVFLSQAAWLSEVITAAVTRVAALTIV